ncbi:MAG: diguanylate cyclase [Alcaligenaceae bacterium]|nr:diguanylate cyclase [Alcaligenaceae bacterium]
MMPSRKLYTRFLQLLLPLLALAYILAAFITAALYYQNQITEADNQRNKTLDTFAHVLIKPLWDCNSLTASGIIHAMILQPEVLGVSALDQCTQQPIQVGVAPEPGDKNTLSTTLQYTDEAGRVHALGELRIAFHSISIFTAASRSLVPQLAVFLSMLAAVLASVLWTVNRTIGSPLATLRQAMREHRPLTPIPDDWTEELMEVTQTYNTQLQDLHRQARHDPLTGLANRLLLEEHLNRTIVQVERTGSQGHVLLLDLDKFKPINDSLGHAAGDEVLRTVAQRLLACVRSTDIVARLGGDEFVIVTSDIPSYPEPDNIDALVQRIEQAMSETLNWHGNTIEISCSIGWTRFRREGNTPAALLAQADAEMYQVKKSLLRDR